MPETVSGREVPLSLLQQRFWYLCTAYTGDASPIVFLAWRVRGPLDVAAWRRAVGAVVDRHEILRTGFVVRDGEPVAVVRPASGIDTELIDLTGRPEEEAARIVGSRTHALLELSGGSLVGSLLLRLGADHHVWCFTMHHILCDAASRRVVAAEVRALYQSYVDGGEPGLPELALQYGDFAVWQALHTREQADDLAYWRERLAGVPPLALPTDHPRPAAKGTASEEIFHQMPPEVGAAVVALSRKARGTPFMVLLAGLQVLLGEWAGQRDFCLGTPVAGRTRTELEPLVGLFANTVALRCDLAGDPTFGELLAATRGEVIGALKRQSVPFGRVVAALDLPRDPSRTQVFQAIFSMRNDNEVKQPQLGDLWIEDFPHGHPKILHDLVVDIWRLDEAGIRTGFRYDTALFSAPTITALARRYEGVLRAATANPDARLSELAAHHA